MFFITKFKQFSPQYVLICFMGETCFWTFKYCRQYCYKYWSDCISINHHFNLKEISLLLYAHNRKRRPSFQSKVQLKKPKCMDKKVDIQYHCMQASWQDSAGFMGNMVWILRWAIQHHLHIEISQLIWKWFSDEWSYLSTIKLRFMPFIFANVES